MSVFHLPFVTFFKENFSFISQAKTSTMAKREIPMGKNFFQLKDDLRNLKLATVKLHLLFPSGCMNRMVLSLILYASDPSCFKCYCC